MFGESGFIRDSVSRPDPRSRAEPASNGAEASPCGSGFIRDRESPPSLRSRAEPAPTGKRARQLVGSAGDAIGQEFQLFHRRLAEVDVET